MGVAKRLYEEKKLGFKLNHHRSPPPLEISSRVRQLQELESTPLLPALPKPPAPIRLPFGPYRGQTIAEVLADPTGADFLRRALGLKLDPAVRKAIEAVVQPMPESEPAPVGLPRGLFGDELPVRICNEFWW